MRQWYCVIGGQRYGPVGEDVLRQWVAEGRLTAVDMVWCEGMAAWVPARSVLPELFGGQPLVPEIVAPSYKPHRGTLVLVMGILGIACCGVFGIVAWVLGSQDLREIDAGRMDPSGRGLTQAGRIIGMITTILMIVGMVIYALLLAVGGLHDIQTHR